MGIEEKQVNQGMIVAVSNAFGDLKCVYHRMDIYRELASHFETTERAMASIDILHDAIVEKIKFMTSVLDNLSKAFEGLEYKKVEV